MSDPAPKAKKKSTKSLKDSQQSKVKDKTPAKVKVTKASKDPEQSDTQQLIQIDNQFGELQEQDPQTDTNNPQHQTIRNYQQQQDDRGNRFAQTAEPFFGGVRQEQGGDSKGRLLQTFSPQRYQYFEAQQPLVCVHHGYGFQYFCETCNEPLCSQCTIVGPHNNQLHRINRINDAYNSKKIIIDDLLKTDLTHKKQQLLAQIHRLEYRIEEIKYVRTIIERDARLEYEGLLERLRTVEGTKLAILQHEITELLRQLDKINDVGQQFQILTTEITDPAPFLLKSRQIYEMIEHLTLRSFKTDINVYPYDLPRELTELRLYLQRAEAQKVLLDQKNDIIWSLISQKKQIEKQIYEELEKQTNQEINEWAGLVDKFQAELNRYQLMCCFCALPLDPKILNQPCLSNVDDAEIQIECVENPPQNFIGQQRHFFSKPYLE